MGARGRLMGSVKGVKREVWLASRDIWFVMMEDKELTCSAGDDMLGMERYRNGQMMRIIA